MGSFELGEVRRQRDKEYDAFGAHTIRTAVMAFCSLTAELVAIDAVPTGLESHPLGRWVVGVAGATLFGLSVGQGLFAIGAGMRAAALDGQLAAHKLQQEPGLPDHQHVFAPPNPVHLTRYLALDHPGLMYVSEPGWTPEVAKR